MLDIVFSKSAAGSLMQAWAHRKGSVRGGAIGLVYAAEDGKALPREELDAAQRRAEERARRERENAVPMPGNRGEVIAFDLAWSIGPISTGLPGRREALVPLWSVSHFPGWESRLDNSLQEAAKNLDFVCRKAQEGEPLRIWYSDNPDEACGFCWLLAQLKNAGAITAPISAVKLAPLQRADGTVVLPMAWGEVSPGEWAGYLSNETRLSPAALLTASHHWSILCGEDAPLRAVLNGTLTGAPADLYDGFIRREIDLADTEFHQARLIATILGKYRLGIGDGWIARRMEQMIASGELEAVTQPGPDEPSYRRILKKVSL